MLVEGDGHAVSRAADGNALVDLAALDCKSQGVGEVGVVARIGAVGAEVDYLMPLAFKILGQAFFVFNTCVIVAYTYNHISSFIL
jgi:hypothetical protein